MIDSNLELVQENRVIDLDAILYSNADLIELVFDKHITEKVDTLMTLKEKAICLSEFWTCLRELIRAHLVDDVKKELVNIEVVDEAWMKMRSRKVMNMTIDLGGLFEDLSFRTAAVVGASSVFGIYGGFFLGIWAIRSIRHRHFQRKLTEKHAMLLYSMWKSSHAAKRRWIDKVNAFNTFNGTLAEFGRPLVSEQEFETIADGLLRLRCLEYQTSNSYYLAEKVKIEYRKAG